MQGCREEAPYRPRHPASVWVRFSPVAATMRAAVSGLACWPGGAVGEDGIASGAGLFGRWNGGECGGGACCHV